MNRNHNEEGRAYNFQDLTGQRFGRLVVLREGCSKNGIIKWVCRCDCGNEKEILAGSLRNGATKSCGCLIREISSERSKKRFTTHGMRKSKEYTSWSNMKARCYNPKDISYKNYGARGITVCDAWLHDFEKFYRDLGPCPEGYSLDRIDVNGNYCPENCKWSNITEQGRNKRNNRMITLFGITKTLSEWKEEMGKNSCTREEMLSINN